MQTSPAEVEKVRQSSSRLKQVYPLNENWLDNEEFQSVLKISRRLAQDYRDKGLIGFSQIGGKIYYRASDIEKLLNSHYMEPFHLKSERS